MMGKTLNSNHSLPYPSCGTFKQLRSNLKQCLGPSPVLTTTDSAPAIAEQTGFALSHPPQQCCFKEKRCLAEHVTLVARLQ